MARQRRFVALALALVASTDALDTIRSHLRKVPEATATADGAEFKGLVEARLEGESLQHTSAGAKHLLFGQEYACEKEVADLKAEIEKLKQKCGPTPVPTVSPTVFEKCPCLGTVTFDTDSLTSDTEPDYVVPNSNLCIDVVGDNSNGGVIRVPATVKCTMVTVTSSGSLYLMSARSCVSCGPPHETL